MEKDFMDIFMKNSIKDGIAINSLVSAHNNLVKSTNKSTRQLCFSILCLCVICVANANDIAKLRKKINYLEAEKKESVKEE